MFSVEGPVAKRIIHAQQLLHAQRIQLGLTYPDWLWRMHKEISNLETIDLLAIMLTLT